MTLYEQIHDDLKTAMKAGDAPKRDTLRMLESALKNEAIEKHVSVTDMGSDALIVVVRRLVKQRHDSVESYRSGGRSDLADKEMAEIQVLEAYLPAALPESELRVLLEEAQAETGATSKADFGKLMGVMVKKVAGRADGATIKKLVEESLL